MADMASLHKVHDRVRILKGDHAGSVGWITRIQVEPTDEIRALVLFTIELSRPYGHVIEALPSMIESDHYKPPASLLAA